MEIVEADFEIGGPNNNHASKPYPYQRERIGCDITFGWNNLQSFKYLVEDVNTR